MVRHRSDKQLVRYSAWTATGALQPHKREINRKERTHERQAEDRLEGLDDLLDNVEALDDPLLQLGLHGVALHALETLHLLLVVLL